MAASYIYVYISLSSGGYNTVPIVLETPRTPVKFPVGMRRLLGFGEHSA